MDAAALARREEVSLSEDFVRLAAKLFASSKPCLARGLHASLCNRAEHARPVSSHAFVHVGYIAREFVVLGIACQHDVGVCMRGLCDQSPLHS